MQKRTILSYYRRFTTEVVILFLKHDPLPVIFFYEAVLSEYIFSYFYFLFLYFIFSKLNFTKLDLRPSHKTKGSIFHVSSELGEKEKRGKVSPFTIPFHRGGFVAHKCIRRTAPYARHPLFGFTCVGKSSLCRIFAHFAYWTNLSIGVIVLTKQKQRRTDVAPIKQPKVPSNASFLFK